MTTSVVVVAFTSAVAYDMLDWADEDVIREARTEKTDRSIVKFDALIVACARWYKVDCIVSLDADVHKLAARAKVDCKFPEQFREPPPAQGNLFDRRPKKK